MASAQMAHGFHSAALGLLVCTSCSGNDEAQSHGFHTDKCLLLMFFPVFSIFFLVIYNF